MVNTEVNFKNFTNYCGILCDILLCFRKFVPASKQDTSSASSVSTTKEDVTPSVPYYRLVGKILLYEAGNPATVFFKHWENHRAKERGYNVTTNLPFSGVFKCKVHYSMFF